MAENRRSLEEQNDDLDLSILVKKFIRFFALNGWLILASTLTGLFCGIILHVAFPKHFTGKLLMESTVLNNLEQAELLDNWQQMAGNGYLLGKQLGCSPKIAQNILGLSSESLPANSDGTNVFTLKVNIKDSSQSQNVQDAILNGMRNVAYVKQKVAIRQANLDNEIGKASGEMERLDSTKTFLESLGRSEKTSNDRLIVDIADISKQKVDIGEKLATYREKMAFSKGVTVVLGFSELQGPKPGLLTLIAVGLIGGFLIGYFVAVLRTLIRLGKQ